MRIYLAVSPGSLREAAAFQTGLAHAAYRIGEGSSLLSRNLLVQTRGGLLVLTDQDAPAVRQPEALAGAILRECGRRSYSGVVLDFENPPTEPLRHLAASLGRQCTAGRKALYLPEAYASSTEQRTVIVNTAVSGGSFEEHLREVCNRYGGGRNVALDIQRLAMSFSLPARTGQGESLTLEALSALLRERQPAVFFSRDLREIFYLYAGRRGQLCPFRRRRDPPPKAEAGTAAGGVRRLFPVAGGPGHRAGAAAPDIKKTCCVGDTARLFLSRNASCSCERPQTSCGASRWGSHNALSCEPRRSRLP